MTHVTEQIHPVAPVVVPTDADPLVGAELVAYAFCVTQMRHLDETSLRRAEYKREAEVHRGDLERNGFRARCNGRYWYAEQTPGTDPRSPLALVAA